MSLFISCSNCVHPFRACQIGNKEIVKILLDHGADARYHPITKYSPLYIACYHGHQEIVEILLLRFPELVQVFSSLEGTQIDFSSSFFFSNIQLKDGFPLMLVASTGMPVCYLCCSISLILVMFYVNTGNLFLHLYNLLLFFKYAYTYFSVNQGRHRKMGILHALRHQRKRCGGTKHPIPSMSARQQSPPRRHNKVQSQSHQSA